jgi:hypothetical protein
MAARINRCFPARMSSAPGVAPRTPGRDDEQERRLRRPLRDRWSSLRAASPSVASLLVWRDGSVRGSAGITPAFRLGGRRDALRGRRLSAPPQGPSPSTASGTSPLTRWSPAAVPARAGGSGRQSRLTRSRRSRRDNRVSRLTALMRRPSAVVRVRAGARRWCHDRWPRRRRLARPGTSRRPRVSLDGVVSVRLSVPRTASRPRARCRRRPC